MSAFMCSARHLTALAAYAVRNGISGLPDAENMRPEKAVKAVFDLLGRANQLSLDARYPTLDNDWPAEPDPKAMLEDFPAIAIIKACHCYEYQACEATTWKGSRAHELLQRIEAHAVRCLPGYDAAPWGL